VSASVTTSEKMLAPASAFAVFSNPQKSRDLLLGRSQSFGSISWLCITILLQCYVLACKVLSVVPLSRGSNSRRPTWQRKVVPTLVGCLPPQPAVMVAVLDIFDVIKNSPITIELSDAP